MDTIGNESTSLEEPRPSKTTSSVGGQVRYVQRRRVILLFGLTGVLFVALFSWVLGPSIKEFLAFKAQHRNDTVTTLTQAYDLFMADLAIKETGFGELIPEADVFIFDEAHQIPDIASQYFGQSLSSSFQTKQF